MTEISIRKDGKAGRITLTRPKSLNALSYEMCLAIEDAIDAWADDPSVELVIIDAEGDKAFCAGGDIAALYETGTKGDYEYARRFWRDEYRLNAKIAEYPKPYVAFMQGFVMGGGVGIACHGHPRIVCESSQIAMPECGIGLVPDVGGTYLLAKAPGRLGEYLGTTGTRMNAGDAIHAGFADHFIPQENWADLIGQLSETGDISLIGNASETPPEGNLDAQTAEIDKHFSGDTLSDIVTSLKSSDTDFAASALKALSRGSPLSIACTIEMLHRLEQPGTDIRQALDTEYRFTHRAMEKGDFLEGVRAAVIDKDRSPKWQHDLDNPPQQDAAEMLTPLGPDALTFEKEG